METVQPHDHAVDLDTALDFVNTLEVRRRPGRRQSWVQPPRPWIGCTTTASIHYEVLGAIGCRVPSCGASVAPGPRCVSWPTRRTSTGRRPRTPSTRSTGPCAPARWSSSSRVRTGSSLDHRHVGDPIDDALANLASRSSARSPAGGPSGSGRAPTTPAAGSSTTTRGRAVDAGATWRAAATGRRPPGTGPRAKGRTRRRRPTERSVADDDVHQAPAGVDHPVGLPPGQQLADAIAGEDDPLELGWLDADRDDDPVADLAVDLDRDLPGLVDDRGRVDRRPGLGVDRRPLRPVPATTRDQSSSVMCGAAGASISSSNRIASRQAGPPATSVPR